MTKHLRRVAFGSILSAALYAAPAQALGPTDDPVLYWNSIVVSTVPAVPGGPPVQSRAAAMVNIAIFDAVNASLGKPTSGYLSGVAAVGGDTRAAAAQAAHDVLVALNPGGQATYDSALAASLNQVSDMSARTAGAATGAAYAAAIIVNRSSDNFASAPASVTPYTPNGNVYDWRPIPTGSTPALPGYGNVTPFLLDSGSEFRPGPPPSLTSAEYTAAYNDVMTLGSATSAVRTADQTAAALFWNQANGVTWLKIGVEAASDNGLSTFQNAQLFALLSTAVGDAFIAGFDTKYTYDFWRPVTAIQNADLDGNPLTIADATWASLIPAPNHPSYLSTHSIASGAGSTVLAALLGNEAFCETLGAFSRCFNSFTEAADDAANSRLWGGIHFNFDNQAGLTAGRSVGAFALADGAFGAVPEPSTWAMLLLGFALIGLRIRRRRGGLVPQTA